MKYSHTILVLILFILTACKTEKKTEPSKPEKELTILEKVAQAHGYDNWKTVEKIKFTFNVDRDTTHFERTWIWKPKTNEVTSISSTDTLTYNRKKMDSVAHKNHSGFINDKYWFLAPYNLIWDAENFTYDHQENVLAPLSKKPMQKLTIVYGSEGGYTPGDAYDFYFEEDYLIKEWVFRRADQAEASMTNTWEDYIEKDGLKIAKMHQNEDGSFKLHFTGIEIGTN